jgi:hypothetical protein
LFGVRTRCRRTLRDDKRQRYVEIDRCALRLQALTFLRPGELAAAE